MDSEYYPLALLLDGHISYLLWTTGADGDRVEVDGGRAVAFDGLSSLRGYAATRRLDLVEAEPGVVFDLDGMTAWLLGYDEPDAVATLNAWNLASDVANSTGASFNHRGEARDAIYDKLFCANNLPAMTPHGDHYERDWSPEELALLREVVGEAVAVVRAATANRP